MRIESDIPASKLTLEAVLEGFVVASAVEIAAGLVPPLPDMAGIRFQPETGERWKLPHETMRDGHGDCEDLSMWEAAGLRVTGQDPGATVRLLRTGQTMMHAVVMRSDGSISDPSMRARARAGAAQLVTAMGGPPPPRGYTVRDRRKRDEQGKLVRPPADPGAPPPAAAPTPGHQPLSPQEQEALMARAAVRAEMERRGMTSFYGSANPTLHRGDQLTELAERAAQLTRDSAFTSARDVAQREALEYRRSRGLTDPDPATWGKGRRGEVDPEHFRFVETPEGGHFQRRRADPLLDALEEQAQYGDPYYDPYGDIYGYGYQFDDGYPMDGGSAYGWWHDGPLLTYNDLYGSPDVEPEYTEDEYVDE